MTWFWLSAVALLVVTLILVLMPWLTSRSSEMSEQGGAAATTGRRRLWPWLSFIVTFIVVGSVTLYMRSPGYHSMKNFYEGKHQAEQLMVRVDAFEQQLQQQGGHHDQWLQLASMRVLLQQPEQAVAAYRAAERLSPIDDVEALLNFGMALFDSAAAQPPKLDEALVLFERVLSKVPEQQMALWYAGQIRFERADFAAAVGHWQRLLSSIQGDSQVGQALRTELSERLAAARVHLPAGRVATQPDGTAAQSERTAAGRVDTQPNGTAAQSERTAAGRVDTQPDGTAAQSDLTATDRPAAQSDGTAADRVDTQPDLTATDPAGTAFTVRVSLDPALRRYAQPQATLFVYARAVSGPPMPLAIKRLSADELPVTVRLSNRDAMMPGMNLDSFPQIEIVARISASGQARPQAGDLMAVSDPYTASTTMQTIDLMIDQIFQP